jgi:Peptidase family S41
MGLGGTFTFQRPDGTTFARTLQPGVTERWVEPPVPLARQHPEKNYWAEYLAPQRALLMRYVAARTIRPSRSRRSSRRRWPRSASARSISLISAIQATPSLNRADVFYVLIGRRTFSSAMMNALQLREQTNATLVGEPTGGTPNSYGEVLSFRLPFSNLVIGYSTKYCELLPGQDRRRWSRTCVSPSPRRRGSPGAMRCCRRDNKVAPR